ncbi:MAG TPA: flagellar hook-basal body complex protein [Anaerolineales bacterium]|nr:flagellar hook-basal body complex protein [Anaerolineales bacterium]HNN12571.1 flagellar hook-basal body complex protein [Anaerolineales bacterium]HNO30500.1 flagellar hook-basal body complex protein [Anaerolineales bacterium]
MASSLFQTLNISRQDIISHLLDLDVTSSNLANVNTAGYKTTRSNFQEMLNEQMKEGTLLRSTQAITTQGTIRTSTNSLDWAIQGEGYFSVTLPDGTIGYTRDGQFALDADLNLVNASGYPLVWDGTIEEGMTNISVSSTGVVTATDAEGVTAEVGTVQLTRFPNPGGLTDNGNNILLESDISGVAQTGDPGSENFGTLSGYHVENSNIDLAQEMTHLITLQRALSMSLRAFQQTDTMIAEAINLRKA